MTNIAIILATYNGERFISEQLDSILENSYQDFEIFVCDDGSTDKTMQIVHEYEEKYPTQVHACPNEKNMGVIRNFLSAVTRYDAKYYMFSDQDDVWMPYKIKMSLKAIQKAEKENPDIPIVLFGDTEVVDINLNQICPSFHKHSNLNPYATDLPHLLMENKLIGCTIMFNNHVRHYLKEFPKEIRMHDAWVGLIGSAFGKVIYLNKPLLKYRQHGNNTLGSMTEMEYILKNMNNLKKQRQALYANCKQAGAFYECFRNELTPNQKYTLKLFNSVPSQPWAKRRSIVFRNGFLKTGVVRNVGNFILL